MIPWSPLARGKLTRPWGSATSRSSSDDYGRNLYPDSDRAIVEAVTDVAVAREVAPAQVALAWVLAQPAITAPIIGATKTYHLDDAVAGVELELTENEIERLESSYTPRPIAGHS